MAFEHAYRLAGPADPLNMKFTVATGQTVTRGQLLELTSGTVQKASNGSTSIIGVALEDGSAGDEVLVMVSNDVVFRVPFTGAVKTSLTTSDIGTAFDITSDADAIDLDDTTGGMCQVLRYDNDKGLAWVVVKGRAFTY